MVGVVVGGVGVGVGAGDLGGVGVCLCSLGSVGGSDGGGFGEY